MEDLFIALWLVRTFLSYLQLTATWQLKEYRFDRMKQYIREQQGLQHLFRLPFRLSLLLFFIAAPAMVFVDPVPELVTRWFPFAYGVLLVADLLEYVVDVYQRKLQRPKFTMKASLVMLLSLGFTLVVWMLCLYQFPSLGVQESLLLLLLLTIIESDFHLISILIMNAVTRVMKSRIYKKARDKRLQFPKLKVIGITGSYGKSSVKEFLSHVLEGQFKVLKTQKNINAEIGIAQTILRDLKPHHEVFVCEMGAYKHGEIAKSCHMAKPQVSVFTGLNSQHQALFGSVDMTFRAKWEIVKSLPADGLAVINGSCEALVKRLKTSAARQLLVPTKKELENVEIKPQSFSFRYHGQDFIAPLVGGFQLENVLMVIDIALHFGMKLDLIAQQVATLQNPAKTCTIQEIPDGLLMDDSYNVNEDGFEAVLKHLSTFQDHQKLVVFSGILELGERSEAIHKEVATALSHAADALILTDPHFASMMTPELYQHGLSRERVLISSDVEQQRAFLKKLKQEEGEDPWVVLFEGRFSRQLLEHFLAGGTFK